MTRTLSIAAIQMDANPAPTADRLARAERLAERAAAAGAQLVVLPELFNIGYDYSDDVHARAETSDDMTVRWLRATAARLGIHLAGSLLLRDDADVFNTLLLFAPDGRSWRYDKNYPWGWERGYFRGRRGTVVAETDLGRFGMLICWDTAHRNLWRQYAGKVDAMLICSCPPDVSNPTYHLGAADLRLDDMGPLMASIKGSGRKLFGDMINEQTAWLGVPAVNTVGCGRISTAIPRGLEMLLALLPSAPWLARYLPRAAGLRMSCELIQGCKIVDAGGHVLAEMQQSEGEGFAIASVSLAEGTPSPSRPQPPSRVPRFAYLSSDQLLPWLMRPVYRSGVRRAWGSHMAARDAAFERGTGVAFAALALVLAIGVVRRRRQSYQEGRL